MQEMGRVDRGHDAVPGDHRYEIFLSFNVVMNLFLRIFQNSSSTVRAHEIEQLFIVLRFLVLPTICYHIFIEQYFEPLDTSGKPLHIDAMPCGNLCTYCLGDHSLFTLEFDREALKQILLADVFHPESRVTLAKFQKAITKNMLLIWGNDEVFVKTIKPQHIHALCLQLVAAEFVVISVPNEKLLGSKKLNKSEMYVGLVKDELTRSFRIFNQSLWEDFDFNFRDGPR